MEDQYVLKTAVNGIKHTPFSFFTDAMCTPNFRLLFSWKNSFPRCLPDVWIEHKGRAGNTKCCNERKGQDQSCEMSILSCECARSSSLSRGGFGASFALRLASLFDIVEQIYKEKFTLP